MEKLKIENVIEKSPSDFPLFYLSAQEPNKYTPQNAVLLRAENSFYNGLELFGNVDYKILCNPKFK